MEFQNWFGAISAFDRNFFASSVLFDLLLSLKNSSYFSKKPNFKNKSPISMKQCSSGGLEWIPGFAGSAAAVFYRCWQPDTTMCRYVTDAG